LDRLGTSGPAAMNTASYLAIFTKYSFASTWSFTLFGKSLAFQPGSVLIEVH